MTRLETRFPFLADYPKVAGEAEAWLRPHSQEYIQSISKAAHALSLPTAVFLRVLCRGMRPRTVLDLGSGFSSFVLRSYDEGGGGRVTSVDDSETWLARTAQFLESRGVSTDQLLSLDEFRSAPPAHYDLIFHDLGSMATRRKTLPLVLELARASRGVVVFDDLHKPSYHEEVRRHLEDLGCHPFDLSSYTSDDYGRYAWLADVGESRS